MNVLSFAVKHLPVVSSQVRQYLFVTREQRAHVLGDCLSVPSGL